MASNQQQAQQQQHHQQSAITLNDHVVESLKPALVFKNFKQEINSVDISHDGKYLVAGCEDFSVSLYDLERGEKVNTYYSKRYGVDLVKFTHHNKCILAASKRDNHQRIMYWSLHDNNILCSFIGHSDMITQIDLNPADSTFVSCARDQTTRVWDYERKSCKIRINKSRASCFDNTGMILACLYFKDQQTPGAASSQGNQKNSVIQQVHLFNTENYEERPFSIFPIDDQDWSAEVKQMKFSPDGQFIMLGTTENIIVLIDSFEGKLKHKFTGTFNELSTGSILEAGFSPDSRYLVTGSEAAKQKIVVWNIESGNEVRLLDFHPTTVAALKFSHVYCMLISACQNLVVWIPDTNHQPTVPQPQQHQQHNMPSSGPQQQQNMPMGNQSNPHHQQPPGHSGPPAFHQPPHQHHHF